LPYQSTSDLPESVKNVLPEHAQEIFLSAFNAAWDEYHHDEERAFAVAWAAVEHSYTKDKESGRWRRKEKES
jgi:cation transport regulator